MQKIKSFLLGVNYAYLFALAVIVKAVVADISPAAMLVTAPILAYEAYKLYLKSKAPDPIRLNNELLRELDNLKAKINALSMEKSVKSSPTRYF
jgi:hypothetical protein